MGKRVFLHEIVLETRNIKNVQKKKKGKEKEDRFTIESLIPRLC